MGETKQDSKTKMSLCMWIISQMQIITKETLEINTSRQSQVDCSKGSSVQYLIEFRPSNMQLNILYHWFPKQIYSMTLSGAQYDITWVITALNRLLQVIVDWLRAQASMSQFPWFNSWPVSTSGIILDKIINF